MSSIRRFMVVAATALVLAALAAACAGPPTVRTAVGQEETLTAAAEATQQDVSPATRVKAYCAVERTAAAAFAPFRGTAAGSSDPAVVQRALTLAVAVAEIAPPEIADDLWTQRSTLRQIAYAIAQGTYDVYMYRRPGPRDATRSPAFLGATARITAFDRDVCGIS